LEGVAIVVPHTRGRGLKPEAQCADGYTFSLIFVRRQIPVNASRLPIANIRFSGWRFKMSKRICLDTSWTLFWFRSVFLCSDMRLRAAAIHTGIYSVKRLKSEHLATVRKRGSK